MDFLVVGSGGPVFEWVRLGIRAACGLPVVSVGDPALLSADPYAPAARICCTNHLTPELAAAVREGRLRAIQTFDTPEDGCKTLGLPKGPRNVAASLYAQGDLLGQPTVMQVDRDSDPAAMLIHFGLGEAAFPPPGVSAAADPKLAELLAPALAYARRGERLEQVWPRSVLLDGDHPDQPLPRVIALAGPARNLAYGPYIGFSPGRARLSVVLAVAPTCRHAEMALELHGGGQLGRGYFILTQPGIFAAEIDVMIPSARSALEIRLKSERGAIEGEIGVDHVRITPN